MSSRRTATREKGSDQDHGSRFTVADQSAEKSDIAPAVPSSVETNPANRSVIVKLLGFTFAMITLPISTYYVTLNNVFKGNSTFAGGAAAIMANIVLVSYVVAAMLEDKSERDLTQQKQKKAE